MLNIRSMRPPDLPAVLRLYETLHPCPEDRSDWSLFHVVVASDNVDAVVGYASALLLPDKTFVLCETLIHLSHRARGIGRRLMEARLRLGTSLGAVEAVGGCDDDHAAMKHLLTSQGFARDVSHPLKSIVVDRPNASLYSCVLGGWA